MNQTEQNTGTRPVADSHRFDIAALEAFLAANLPGFVGPLSVEQFKGGQSNPTFQLITPTQTYVMRSKPGPAAKLLPSAHAIDREYRVMAALGNTDVPGGAHVASVRRRKRDRPRILHHGICRGTGALEPGPARLPKRSARRHFR